MNVSTEGAAQAPDRASLHSQAHETWVRAWSLFVRMRTLSHFLNGYSLSSLADYEAVFPGIVENLDRWTGELDAVQEGLQTLEQEAARE